MKSDKILKNRSLRKQPPFAIYIIAVALVVIAIALVIIVINTFIGGDFSPFNMMHSQTNSSFIGQMMGSGMMGGMMGGGMAGYTGTQTNISADVQEAKTIPPYAKISSNNTIAFNSTSINITILAMGVQRAVNVTGATPPPYSNASEDNVFVIDGKIDPTLIVPKGATFHVTFINLDSSEYHNVIFTASPPPYSYMPYQAMNGLLSMMPLLQHADYPTGIAYAYSFSFDTPSNGTFWYICMYPGHAQMGMYGKLTIV